MPGRVRIAATYRAFRSYGRVTATMATLGHFHGWLTGTLRTTVDGQRWLNVHVPGTCRARRFAGGAVEAIAVLVVGVIYLAVIAHLTGSALDVALAVSVVVLLADAAAGIRYQWLRRRCVLPPPRPQRCAVVTSVAKDADATYGDLRALKRDMESWLDTYDLALCIQARPRLVPLYLRFLPLLRPVGTTPPVLSKETLTTLERPRRLDH